MSKTPGAPTNAPAPSIRFSSLFAIAISPSLTQLHLRTPPPRAAARLEGRDLVLVAEREVEVVPAVEELRAPHRVDVEGDLPVAVSHDLSLEVDRQLMRAGLQEGDQVLGVGFRDPHRDEP